MNTCCPPDVLSRWTLTSEQCTRTRWKSVTSVATSCSRFVPALCPHRCHDAHLTNNQTNRHFSSPFFFSFHSLKFVTIPHVALKYTTRAWQDTLKEERSRGARPARTSGHTKSLVCVYVRMCVCAFIVNLQTIFICNFYIVIQHFQSCFQETRSECLRCSYLSLQHFNEEVRDQILFNAVFHMEATSLRERKQSVQFSLTKKPCSCIS